jgi:hypothetical protein
MSKRHALDAPAEQQRASIPPIPSGDVGISGSATEDAAQTAYEAHRRIAIFSGRQAPSWYALNEGERNAWRGHVGAPKLSESRFGSVADTFDGNTRPIDEAAPSPRPITGDDGSAYFPPPPLDSAWQPDVAPSPADLTGDGGDGGTLALRWRDSGATHQFDAQLSANEAQQVASYVSHMLKGRSA